MTRPNYELWVHEINENDGLLLGGKRYPVELVEYDDRSSSEEAVRAIERLVTQDKVDILLAPWSTAINLAVGPQFHRYGFPQITSTSITDRQPDLARRWPLSFLLMGTATSYVQSVADVLVEAREAGQIGAAVLTGALVYALLTHTRVGAALRAVAVDPAGAQLVGIDTRWAADIAYGLGGAIGALGGVLVSTYLTFTAEMGVVFTMKALIVVIMAGAGHVPGALIAGLMLGIVEAFVAAYLDPGLTVAVIYAVFLATLIVRPAGIFGNVAR